MIVSSDVSSKFVCEKFYNVVDAKLSDDEFKKKLALKSQLL